MAVLKCVENLTGYQLLKYEDYIHGISLMIFLLNQQNTALSIYEIDP